MSDPDIEATILRVKDRHAAEAERIRRTSYARRGGAVRAARVACRRALGEGFQPAEGADFVIRPVALATVCASPWRRRPFTGIGSNWSASRRKQRTGPDEAERSREGAARRASARPAAKSGTSPTNETARPKRGDTFSVPGTGSRVLPPRWPCWHTSCRCGSARSSATAGSRTFGGKQFRQCGRTRPWRPQQPPDHSSP